MVNWSSPAEIAHDSVSLDRLIHCFFGLYIWEWVVSLDFEWQFISGKKKFRWPMAFYFLNRYCLMASLIGIVVALNVTGKVNCQALYTSNLCLGNSAIGLASINLSLRTMAIWSHRWYIVAPLSIMILGHWSLLVLAVFGKAAWVPGEGCVIIATDYNLLAATFTYSMVFDFVVLMLTGYKLCNPAAARSKLVVLIFSDGLVYFIIAFLLNAVAAVFMLHNLNPIMSVVANIPVTIFSTLVAGQVVKHLNDSTPPTASCAELYPTTQGATVAHHSGVSGFLANRPTSIVDLEPSGVHVHMEIFRSSNDGILEYDMKRKVTTDVKLDPEAQVIVQEFNPPPY